ncbi:hypothetical protein [Clostridium paraputrificum]|uniref:hypothetical protein n=1 Tax=Clostridium paraputrificum TaxID=29363 RepID=UPI0004046206|nr:hypothetical protein [Clostridium paraputrificum]
MKIKYTSIIALILFLIFLGVAGLENYFVIIALAVISLIGISKNDLKKAVGTLLPILVIHTIIYYYNYSTISLDWVAKNLINPVILCFLGYWMTLNMKSDKGPAKVMIIGLFMHGALNVLLYVMNPASMVDRSLVNIWGGSITATLQNILFIPIVSLLFYGLYIVHNKIEKVFIIVAILIAIYCTFISASRTLLFLIVISFFIVMILNFKKNKYKNLNILISMFLLIIILYVVYEFDLMGVRTWIESSSLVGRILGGINSKDSVLENVRWEMNLKVLASLSSNPFGKITVVNYAHNLFLDIAKYTGIIPALSIFVWCITEIVKYYKHVKVSSNEWDINLFSISVCLMIVFFLEPVLEGIPIIFGAFCYLCGIMKARRGMYIK